MSEQNSGANRPQNSGRPNNNRRHHHRRRPHNGAQGGQQGGPQQNSPQGGQQSRGASPAGSSGGGQSQSKRHHHHRGGHHRHRHPDQRPQGQSSPQGVNLDRIYEKYLNLLDQHLIARRKYHDMFYRAEPAQKAKLERNFYNTLNDVREFENKLAPDVRVMFEKRNNGLRPDTIYTTNHDIVENVESNVLISEEEIEDPHFLQSQKLADYSGDTEESVGTLDDYLRYKNLL